MADDDALSPGQYPGQWYGLPSPYAGLNQMDPLYQYTFGPPIDQPELANPQHGLYPELAGIQANFDPTLSGNVEEVGRASEWDRLLSILGFESTGLAAPGGAMGAWENTSAPWIGAPQPGGTLQGAAGFGDIGGL